MLVDLKEKPKMKSEEGDQEEKEVKESEITDDKPGQEEMKTDMKGLEVNRLKQVEQQPKNEEGDSNPGGAPGSEQDFTDNKKPEIHTDKQQCHNGMHRIGSQFLQICLKTAVMYSYEQWNHSSCAYWLLRNLLQKHFIC